MTNIAHTFIDFSNKKASFSTIFKKGFSMKNELFPELNVKRFEKK